MGVGGNDVNAAEIAAALGDARREGRGWRCRCPLHGGRSLVIRNGDGGNLLATCWYGCDRLDVLAELRRRGLLDGRASYAPRIGVEPRRNDDALRIAWALKIWGEARDSADSIAHRYLTSRSIVLDRPPSLRFHARCPRPRDDNGNLLPPLPAMVALVEHAQRGPVAVHCTYLLPDGSDKAALPKDKQRAFFGPVAGGAVRFGVPRPGVRLIVGEGIESTLSAAVPCGLPAWAALSAAGIEKLLLPPDATHVVIAADNDTKGRGQRAANDAAERWLGEGRSVRVAMPPKPDSDFNDLLRNGAAYLNNEASYVVARRD
jgi:putative DNA primase/helicase